MDAEEKYLFDLMGFLVVKQVLSRGEVDELNALIDSYDLWRKAESGQESAWVNDPNFMTVGALHTWDEPFRRLLAHPRMLPYVETLVGPRRAARHCCRSQLTVARSRVASGARPGATTSSGTATSRTACRAGGPTFATARWSTYR